MPLPASAIDRTHLHTRRIICDGYERADGLYDIEGWLTDTKGQPMKTVDKTEIPPGEPIHGMGLRLTLDAQYMIHDAVAVMDQTPTRMCVTAAPNFKRLIGLNIASGFRQKIKELLGQTEGCTHLIDLLAVLGTVARQTLTAKAGAPHQEKTAKSQKDMSHVPPALINSCRGWADDGQLVQAVFPQWAKASGSPKP